MTRYDAIVLDVRCAGSPTAMLLARKGSKVLVVDQVASRATRRVHHHRTVVYGDL